MKNKEALPAKRYVIGNWKSMKSLADSHRWFDEFAKLYRPAAHLEVVVAPPIVWLAPLADYLKKLELANVSLAAQDVSPFPPGRYTGAVAADMLRTIADFVIAGHSERRRYFHETPQDVTNKISETVDAGLTPIICLDKTYAMSQLTALGDIDFKDLVIAYCPVDALSYREPEAPEQVAEAMEFIAQIQPNSPIIYGGAVTVDNAVRYSSIPGVSGVFAGTASLDPDEFAELADRVSQ